MGESTCRVMPLNAHRLDAAINVPAFVGNRAEHFARDHHVGVAAIVGRSHLGPSRRGGVAEIGRKTGRDDMGMDVDCVCGHRGAILDHWYDHF
jgi:hypothetical protein